MSQQKWDAEECINHALLGRNGFELQIIELIPRLTSLISGISKWLEIFVEGITVHLTTEQRKIFINLVKDKLKPVLYSEKEGWVADYVRLRFEAIKIE